MQKVYLVEKDGFDFCWWWWTWFLFLIFNRFESFHVLYRVMGRVKVSGHLSISPVPLQPLNWAVPWRK